MPVVINEIVIKTNVENPKNSLENTSAINQNNLNVNEIVQQAVSKVLEVLNERNQR
jgi:hypothetical protein